MSYTLHLTQDGRNRLQESMEDNTKFYLNFAID